MNLDEWKQERDRRYAEVRAKTADLSDALKRAVEVEEIISQIEKEKDDNRQSSMSMRSLDTSSHQS